MTITKPRKPLIDSESVFWPEFCRLQARPDRCWPGRYRDKPHAQGGKEKMKTILKVSTFAVGLLVAPAAFAGLVVNPAVDVIGNLSLADFTGNNYGGRAYKDWGNEPLSRSTPLIRTTLLSRALISELARQLRAPASFSRPTAEPAGLLSSWCRRQRMAWTFLTTGISPTIVPASFMAPCSAATAIFSRAARQTRPEDLPRGPTPAAGRRSTRSSTLAPTQMRISLGSRSQETGSLLVTTTSLRG